jgi:adenosylcobinamide-GDP ribazoletransferase
MAAKAIAVAPFVGVLLGVPTVAALVGLAWLHCPPLLAGLLVVGLLALATRGMHVDGLADTADGLGCYGPPERALAVMKDGGAGPFAVVTLIVVLGVQAVGFGAVAASAHAIGFSARATGVPAGLGAAGAWVPAGLGAAGAWVPAGLGAAGAWVPAGLGAAGAWVPAGFGAAGAWVPALALAAGRAAFPLCCRRGVPAARPTGLGALVAGTQPAIVPALWWLALAAAGAFVVPGRWWQGTLSVVLAGAVVLGLSAHTRRRFGGVTGDVLGAAGELAVAVVLVVCSFGCG